MTFKMLITITDIYTWNFIIETQITVILVHSIEGEYVPLPGDEVIYRLCPIPPKFEKNQAVHVRIVHLTPEKHLKWDEPQCN